jgi:hypothetical protein
MNVFNNDTYLLSAVGGMETIPEPEHPDEIEALMDRAQACIDTGGNAVALRIHLDNDIGYLRVGIGPIDHLTQDAKRLLITVVSEIELAMKEVLGELADSLGDDDRCVDLGEPGETWRSVLARSAILHDKTLHLSEMLAVLRMSHQERLEWLIGRQQD